MVSKTNVIFVAVVTASMLNPKMSPAEKLVVHPLSVDERLALPVDKAGFALAVIVFATVGSAVPVAIFHTSIVQVGLEPVAVIDHPVIVPGYGVVK